MRAFRMQDSTECAYNHPEVADVHSLCMQCMWHHQSPGLPVRAQRQQPPQERRRVQLVTRAVRRPDRCRNVLMLDVQQRVHAWMHEMRVEMKCVTPNSLRLCCGVVTDA